MTLVLDTLAWKSRDRAYYTTMKKQAFAGSQLTLEYIITVLRPDADNSSISP